MATSNKPLRSLTLCKMAGYMPTAEYCEAVSGLVKEAGPMNLLRKGFGAVRNTVNDAWAGMSKARATRLRNAHQLQQQQMAYKHEQELARIRMDGAANVARARNGMAPVASQPSAPAPSMQAGAPAAPAAGAPAAPAAPQSSGQWFDNQVNSFNSFANKHPVAAGAGLLAGGYAAGRMLSPSPRPMPSPLPMGFGWGPRMF